MRDAMILAATALALAGCGKQRGAEKVVLEQLKDPDSARFGEFYFNDKTKKGCLTVNAKNSMGGYTGDEQAYVKQTDKGWEGEGIAKITVDMCREVFADAVY